VRHIPADAPTDAAICKKLEALLLLLDSTVSHVRVQRAPGGKGRDFDGKNWPIHSPCRASH
jgi:hypothetical protein